MNKYIYSILNLSETIEIVLSDVILIWMMVDTFSSGDASDKTERGVLIQKRNHLKCEFKKNPTFVSKKHSEKKELEIKMFITKKKRPALNTGR